MRNLSEAVVLVVGASGGLGRELCLSLAARGARLCLTSRSADRLLPIAAEAAQVIVGDLADPQFPARAVAETRARFGRLDGVVNAAGVVAFGPLADTTDATLEALLAVNLLGPIRLMRAFAAEGEGGFFVSLSGVVAEAPVLGVGAYGASKAALSHALRVFAMEGRRKRITVLDARPPHTETGLASRPLAGTPPRMPAGLLPREVAERIVLGIEQDEREIPSAVFRSNAARP